MCEHDCVEVGHGSVGSFVDGHLELGADEVFGFAAGFEHEAGIFGDAQALVVAVEAEVGRAENAVGKGNRTGGLNCLHDHFEFFGDPYFNFKEIERGPE